MDLLRTVNDNPRMAQILINKTPVKHINPDVRNELKWWYWTNDVLQIMLLGNADDIVAHLCQQLRWTLPPPTSTSNKRPLEQFPEVLQPQRVGDSHVWLFKGAEGGQFVEKMQAKDDEGQESDPQREVKRARVE